MSAVLLGLATFASCGPLIVRKIDGKNGDGKNDNSASVDEICKSHTYLKEYAGAAQAWDETGAGAWLDMLLHGSYARRKYKIAALAEASLIINISIIDEQDWLNVMAVQVFPENGPSSLSGCKYSLSGLSNTYNFFFELFVISLLSH